jgi:hypothetical protein
MIIRNNIQFMPKLIGDNNRFGIEGYWFPSHMGLNIQSHVWKGRIPLSHRFTLFG